MRMCVGINEILKSNNYSKYNYNILSEYVYVKCVTKIYSTKFFYYCIILIN